MLHIFRYELRSQWKRFSAMTLMLAIALTCYMIIDASIMYADNRIAAEAKPLAWADIVVQNNRWWDDESTNRIAALVGDDWTISKRIQLNTNITSETDSRLVQLLGVDGEFPLYGKIDIVPLSGQTFTFGSSIAVDQRTFDMLNWGDITLWDRQGSVQGIIQDNPSLSLNLFTQWRQVIAPLSLLEETGLLRTWSRAEYQHLIKVFDTTDTKALLQALRADSIIQSNQWRAQDFQSRVEQVGSILDELGTYLLLVIFCAFLLVAVTSMLSIDEYLYRRLKTISIMQILGARKLQLFAFYGMIFVSMTILSLSIAHGLVSWAAYYIWSLVTDFSIARDVRIRWVWVALILTTVAWSLPLLKIAFRSPLEGLAESTINISTKKELILWTLITISWIVWVLRIIGESRQVTAILGSFLSLGCLVIRGCVQGLFAIGNWINKKSAPSFIIFDAIRSTTRPGNTSTLIAGTLIVAVSTALLITQFGSSFTQRLTFNNETQPNRYIINLTRPDLDTLRAQWIQDPAFNTILGRIVSINNTLLADHVEKLTPQWWGEWWSEWWGEGRFSREYNITTASLPENETIVWPSIVAPGGVSVAEEFAKDIGISLWDTIVFSIAGREFTVTVTSLREINRASFTPFFYFQLNEEQFVDAPMNYFLTLRVDDESKDEMRTTIARSISPGVAFIEIDSIIASVRTISDRVIQVVQILLGVILLFTCFTNIVCVENMRYAKAYKMKLYSILWANKMQSRLSIVYEYGYIVCVALLTSMMLGWWIAAYFIGTSDFLSRSRRAVWQWCLIIIGICLLNMIVIWRTVNRKNS